MIQLMNEKEVLLGQHTTPRTGHEDAAAGLKTAIIIPTDSTGTIKARIAKEQTLSCDDIRDMDDDTFIASLHGSS